jgi:hypothetical protein
MHPNPLRDLAVAYHHVTLRPPAWVRHPTLSGYGGIDGIVDAIRDDHPDPARSDAALRALLTIGRGDGRAATVALFSLAVELERRVSRAATREYRADALGELAAVILEGNTTGNGLGHRYVNRAHNRTHKHHHRVRHHGRAVPSTVDPLPTDRIIEHYDRQLAPTDVADLVAARVDLQRFGAAVAAAIADGEVEEQTWTSYADHRLRVLYLPGRAPVPTRQRVAAYRAAKKLQPFIDVHLQGHAA